MSCIQKTFLIIPVLFSFFSCSVSYKIKSLANKQLYRDSIFSHAHSGIAIFEPGKNTFLYKHQSDKYFIPASNVKIPTLYAGLKYLPNRLEAFRYRRVGDTLFIVPTGDPTFLHPDFYDQPAFNFLKKQPGHITITSAKWKTSSWGRGWMWDDYNKAFMAERSAFPIYGNIIRWVQVRDSSSIAAMAREEAFIYSEPDINWKVDFSSDTSASLFSVRRSLNENKFFITQGKELHVQQEVPFITGNLQAALELLKDTLGNQVDSTTMSIIPEGVVYSQLSDSLYRLMMHQSNNFYAEQILLMAADRQLKIIDENEIIPYLLNNDLADFPQQPRWVDGSGLSRYNLFTPEDFVWLLNKMVTEFGMERIKRIFPAAGEGTLQQFNQSDPPFIYAKTGTMSDVWCISGFLYTKSRKPLIFSVLVNNHRGSVRNIREKINLFLKQVSERN